MEKQNQPDTRAKAAACRADSLVRSLPIFLVSKFMSACSGFAIATHPINMLNALLSMLHSLTVKRAASAPLTTRWS